MYDNKESNKWEEWGTAKASFTKRVVPKALMKFQLPNARWGRWNRPDQSVVVQIECGQLRQIEEVTDRDASAEAFVVSSLIIFLNCDNVRERDTTDYQGRCEAGHLRARILLCLKEGVVATQRRDWGLQYEIRILGWEVECFELTSRGEYLLKFKYVRCDNVSKCDASIVRLNLFLPRS